MLTEKNALGILSNETFLLFFIQRFFSLTLFRLSLFRRSELTTLVKYFANSLWRNEIYEKYQAINIPMTNLFFNGKISFVPRVASKKCAHDVGVTQKIVDY